MKGHVHMKKALTAAAAAIATLVLASGALAANTAKVTVWHTPMAVGSTSTTIHVSVPQTTDPIAAINIFAPSGYSATLSQAAGTKIGSVTATAFSYDNNLTLPLDGTVTTDDPAKHTTDACSPGTNAAVWNLNLSVAGQTLIVPIYVNPTSGASAALGAYNLKICLAPPDLPAGTPGRAAFGAQLLDAKFTVDGIFKAPAAAGMIRWETLFTPWNKGKGTVNPAGTFEARSFVGLPVTLGMTVKYTKKTKTFIASGKLAEGGQGVAEATVNLLRGASATKQAKIASTPTTATGTWSKSGKLTGKKPFFFKATATVGERDYTAAGCQSPLPATVAPAGCVSATLPPWTATSAVVRIKP
jgi:hypothetical protein